MLTVKEILDNATSSLRPVSLTGYPHTLQESLQLYTDYCCGSGEVVTPPPVPPFIRFDFTNGLYMAESGGVVTAVEDSISHYWLEQNTTSRKPFYDGSGVGFDGIDDRLETSIVVNNPFTIIVIMDCTDQVEDVVISNAYNDYVFGFVLGNLRSGNLGSNIITPLDGQERMVMSLRADSATTVQRLNGVNNSGSAFNNSSLRISYIGSYPFYSHGFHINATLRHIVIYNRMLNMDEIISSEVYYNGL